MKKEEEARVEGRVKEEMAKMEEMMKEERSKIAKMQKKLEATKEGGGEEGKGMKRKCKEDEEVKEEPVGGSWFKKSRMVSAT